MNIALGGSLDNFDPAIKFFKELKKNEPIVPKQTSYARVISGEIPILFDYDFNAYRGKYKDKANVEFVIPAEGTIMAPYVMSLVKSRPPTQKTERRFSISCSLIKARLSGQTPFCVQSDPPP